MKRNVNLTLCGITVGLSVIFMMLAYFPYFTYAVPAVVSLLAVMLVIETNIKWAFASYIASSVLVFLFAEPESKLMFICFFGYYPIAKALIERINNPIIEWVLKLAVFNAAMVAVYLFFAGLFGISINDFGALGKYGALIFLGMGNVVFVLYDYTVSKLIGTYILRMQPKVRRIFKR